ncbi:MAG: helix-turn-helix domain-containing protein [Kiloniellales bacterium]
MAKKDSKDPYKVAVGQRLRDVRLALDYGTTRAFAEILEVDEDRLGKWETGINLLPPPYAIKLKKRFRVTADWLYDGDPTGLPVGLYQELQRLQAV